MEKDAVGGATGIDGYLFRLIATFEAAAMQQLGKIAHPLTGDVEVDLSGASDSIEMLAAIQRKTDGNLNADEKRLLEHVLYQLRMNYVDVAKEQGEAKAEDEPAGEADGPDAETDAGEPAAETDADEPAAETDAGEPAAETDAGESVTGAVPDTGEEQTG
jgi:hypothetical protein